MAQLYGQILLRKNIKKLQKVQNFAARIITCTRKYEHITPVIRQLGWLPVADMLKYYLGILTFKCLNGLAPDYLSTLLRIDHLCMIKIREIMRN